MKKPEVKKVNVKQLKTNKMKTKKTNENLVNNSNQNLNYLKIKLQNLENELFEKTEEIFKSSELFKLIEQEGLKYNIHINKYREFYLDSPTVIILKDELLLLHLKGDTQIYFGSERLILNELTYYNQHTNYLNPLGNPYSNKGFQCNDNLYISKETNRLPNYNISLEENIKLLKFLFEWETDKKDKLKEKFSKLYEKFITDYFKPLKELRDEIIELEKIKIFNYKTNKENQIEKWLKGLDKVEIKGRPEIEEYCNDDYDVIGVEKKLIKISGFYTKCKRSYEKGHNGSIIHKVGNIIKIDKNKYFVKTENGDVLFTTKNLTELLSEIYDWNEKQYFKELGEIDKRLNQKYGIENPTDLNFDDYIIVNENHLVSNNSF